MSDNKAPLDNVLPEPVFHARNYSFAWLSFESVHLHTAPIRRILVTKRLKLNNNEIALKYCFLSYLHSNSLHSSSICILANCKHQSLQLAKHLLSTSKVEARTHICQGKHKGCYF